MWEWERKRNERWICLIVLPCRSWHGNVLVDDDYDGDDDGDGGDDYNDCADGGVV